MAEIEFRGRRLRRALCSLAALVALGTLAGCEPDPVVLQGQVSVGGGNSFVAGVVVTVYAPSSEEVVATTVTAADGRFRLRASSLPEGTYRVRVSDRFWWDGASDWEGATDVLANAASPPSLVMAIPSFGGGLGGNVRDGGAPVGGVDVDALSTVDGRVVAATSTSADGAYELAELPPGDYRLRFRAPGRATTYSGSSPSAASAAIVSALAGVPTGDVDVEMPVESSITGRVLGPDGPRGGLYVGAIVADGELLVGDTTDGDGRFTLDTLSSTAYVLLVVDPSGDLPTTIVGTDGLVPADGQSFTPPVAGALDVGDLVIGAGPPPLPSPSWLSASAGDGTVALSWEAVTGATDYEVQRAPSADGPWTVLDRAPSPDPSHADVGLANGTEVFYRVRALADGRVPSVPSATVSVTPGPVTPTCGRLGDDEVWGPDVLVVGCDVLVPDGVTLTMVGGARFEGGSITAESGGRFRTIATSDAPTLRDGELRGEPGSGVGVVGSVVEDSTLVLRGEVRLEGSRFVGSSVGVVFPSGVPVVAGNVFEDARLASGEPTVGLLLQLVADVSAVEGNETIGVGVQRLISAESSAVAGVWSLDAFEDAAFFVDSLVVEDGGSVVVPAGGLVQVGIQGVRVDAGGSLTATGAVGDEAALVHGCDAYLLDAQYPGTGPSCDGLGIDAFVARISLASSATADSSLLDLARSVVRGIDVQALSSTGGSNSTDPQRPAVEVSDSVLFAGSLHVSVLDELAVVDNELEDFPLDAGQLERPVLVANTWSDTDAPVVLADIEDLSGVAPDNVLSGADRHQRSMHVASSSVPGGATWTLGPAANLVHVLDDVRIVGTAVADDAQVLVHAAWRVFGTLLASNAELLPADEWWSGIHAYGESTVTISDSTFRSAAVGVSANHTCLGSGSDVVVAGSVFDGVETAVANCRWDGLPGFLPKPVAIGNTDAAGMPLGQGSYPTHTHTCYYQPLSPPGLPPVVYNITLQDVDWGVPDEECAPPARDITIGTHPG